MKEDYYKKILMESQVGYAFGKIVLDDDGRPEDLYILEVNPAFCRHTGLLPGQIENKRVGNALPDLRAKGFTWIEKIGEVACNGSSTIVEDYVAPLDLWLRVELQSPEYMYVSATLTDITHERGLREEYELLANNISTQIWYLKDLETYGNVNRAHADFLGRTVEDVQNKSLYEVLSRSEADICVSGNQRVFNEKKALAANEWVTNAAGESRLLRITKNPKLASDGSVRFVVCSAEDVTEHHFAEQALRRSEERLRRIFEHAPFGIMHVNVSGRITDCNDQFVSIIGTSREQLLGFDVLSIQNTDAKKAITDAFKGNVSDYEGVYTSMMSGKTTPVRGFFTPLKADDGSVTGILGIIEDITERIEAENALRASEEQLRSLFEAMDELIFMVDEDLVFREYHMPKSRKFRLSEDHFLGKSVYEASFPRPARDKVIEGLKKARDKNRFTNVEYYLDLLGGRSWYDMNINPARDKDGRKVLVAVVRDVTARKQAELDLMESEQKYRQLFEDAPISLWEKDFSIIKHWLNNREDLPSDNLESYFLERPEMVRKLFQKVKILDVNQRTLKLYKEEHKNSLIKGLNSIFTEHTWKDFARSLAAIARGDQNFTAETRHKTLDGEIRDVSIHWKVAPGYEKSYARVLHSEFDITEQKKAEEQIRENLREKNILLAEIHHRVKNNMAVISSLLTLQSEFQSDADPEKILRDTRNRIQSMGLVHELVYEHDNFAEINFRPLLERLVQILSDVYLVNDKEISVNVSCDDVQLDLNRSMPCTLIANELMSNAFQHAFSQSDKGNIDVIFEKKADTYRLVIRDDGEGIDDPGDLENPGSFGYTIIHGLVQQIRGDISFSAENPGLSVEVTFHTEQPGK